MERAAADASEGAVEVAVVGAGVSGLVLTRELADRGRDIVALEAETRPGGVIQSRRVEGRLVELGPQRTRLTPPVEGLVDELGLRDELLTAPSDLPLFVYRGGRLRRAPLGPADLLRTDLLSLPAKLRFLMEPLTRPPRPEESVAEAFRRRYGGAAYRHFLGPLFGGIYASEPGRMPARHSLIPLWRAMGAPRSFVVSAALRALTGGERPPAVSFRDGLGTLTDALGRACGDRLRTGSPVEALVPGDDVHRLRLRGGGSLRARAVVLTVPSPVAADLLEEGGVREAGALRELRYNPLAVVHLSSPLERPGYGYQISLAETGFVTRGVTWNASLFGRDDVYTAYLGGMGREEAVARPDGWLGETAAEEFERVTGARARPLAVHRTRIPAHDESWRHLPEALDALPTGVHACANWESQAGIPARVREARGLAARLDGSLSPRREPEAAARR